MAISAEPKGADKDTVPSDMPSTKRKVVVVGLGMVGIAFMYDPLRTLPFAN